VGSVHAESLSCPLQQRAALHRKFCLIHRSWTPYVLRSLYRSPRLTSRFAIQRLHDCLAHPENLWGVDLDEETGKVIGGPVGDRRYFVRHLGFYTGTGVSGGLGSPYRITIQNGPRLISMLYSGKVLWIGSCIQASGKCESIYQDLCAESLSSRISSWATSLVSPGPRGAGPNAFG
jgi:hypothetical protein